MEIRQGFIKTLTQQWINLSLVKKFEIKELEGTSYIVAETTEDAEYIIYLSNDYEMTKRVFEGML